MYKSIASSKITSPNNQPIPKSSGASKRPSTAGNNGAALQKKSQSTLNIFKSKTYKTLKKLWVIGIK